MDFLLQRAEFKRFLFSVIQMARIFQRTTDGSDERNLGFDEGRRSLGLEILEMVEMGQPVTHSEGIPALTVIQTFLEATQHQPEKPSGGRNQRYDRTSELDSGDE